MSNKKFKTKNWHYTIWKLENDFWIKIAHRSDMKISTYLGRIWFPSLQKLIENK
jgi:hypothetical protein